MLDAIVVGSGPNGLAAAITLAEAGRSVRVYEAAPTPGGGTRSAELTLPGFTHDVCSTVQTAMLASPFFRGQEFGLELCYPEVQFAQPIEGDRAVALYRDIDRTAGELGADAAVWRDLFTPLVAQADGNWPDLLGTLRRIPRHPIGLARFGLPSLRSAHSFAGRFHEPAARALFAGVAAHSMRRLDAPFTTAYGLVLAVMGHRFGWPVVAGGSERIADALVRRLTDLGGEIVCDSPISSLAELPPARVRLLDIGPAQLHELAGQTLPGWYRTALRRYRYGSGVCKIDYALSEPVPWLAEACRAAGTVHIGGTFEEVAASESDAEAGRPSAHPFVLGVQATVMDPSRAPADRHTFWAYSHVPAGSAEDHSPAIEAQIERFAPGFRDVVLAKTVRTAAAYAAYNPNYVGGDINAGRPSMWASFLGPVPNWSRYRVPLPGTYLCSSATPPGGGVHGMCGALAAELALRRELG